MKRTSYLIGDSTTEGADTVISESLDHTKSEYYTFAELNQRRLREAREFAKAHNYTNIRIVTTWWDGICIPMGVIDWRKGKTMVKPFDFDKVNEIN